MEYEIQTVSQIDHLEEIKVLWRDNSKTLGFFPEGAFEEHAKKKSILVALNGDQRVVGYLLYRNAKNRIMITHLCVSPERRGQGIAKQLVESLVSIARDSEGIGLKCRTDFDADKLWPLLGFTVQNYICGRGKDRKKLGFWWRSNNHPNLFTHAASQIKESKICAVVDVNILLDFIDIPSTLTIPSMSLIADWISEDLELFITEEVSNEIHRTKDSEKRKKLQSISGTFHVITADSVRVDQIQKELRPLFPEQLSEQDFSDLMHVCRSIASDMQYFITRDTELLNKSEDVESLFGLTILEPTSLIIKLDELKRRDEYQPASFSETILTERLIDSHCVENLYQSFHSASASEKKRSFYSKVNAFLSKPEQYECRIIEDQSQCSLAFYVTDKSICNTSCYTVEMLRFPNNRLSSTLARRLIRHFITRSVEDKRKMVKIKERHLDDYLETALYDAGFFEMDYWYKINLPVVDTAHNIGNEIMSFVDMLPCEDWELEEWVNNYFRDHTSMSNANIVTEEEHRLWPAKILDGEMNNYIIPIRPQWAQELFDLDLAKQVFYSRKTELGLNIESIYYRSSRGKILWPARVLWYISQDKNVLGSKSIRACSVINNVDVDLPKKIYKKYKHLGIYEWKDVSGIVKNDISKKVMALRFSDTELFENMIVWDDVQKILLSHGIKTQLISPVQIPSETFIEIYKKAIIY